MRRPWRRRGVQSAEVAVHHELFTRRMTTLEDCRVAWEEAADPLALTVAVTKTDLPPWLADALRVALDATKTDRGRAQLARQWRRREKDALDRARVWDLTDVRSPHEGPRASGATAIQRAADAHAVSEKAITRAFGRVRRGLANRGRYYAMDGASAPKVPPPKPR